MHAGTGVIPAGAYSSLTVDYPSTALAIYVLASASTPDQDVYKVTRAIYRQFGYLKSLHPLMRDYQPVMLADATPFPLHPGAARFYAEVGLPR
ncbi:MAG: TAXI family TRAP transporter solute-binding subunit [Immundisolibacter sp.]|uniref:TAXI family TRAP transporter solute-binding subunit n=1 Tax=Immundisolibacter sp. TaxID=1934948 RepID=UPI003EDE9D4F